MSQRTPFCAETTQATHLQAPEAHNEERFSLRVPTIPSGGDLVDRVRSAVNVLADLANISPDTLKSNLDDHWEFFNPYNAMKYLLNGILVTPVMDLLQYQESIEYVGLYF